MQKILVHSKRNSKNTLYLSIHQREADYGVWDFTELTFVSGEGSMDDTIDAVDFDTTKGRYVINIPEDLPTGKEYDIVLYDSENDKNTVVWGVQVFLDKTKGFVRPGDQHNLPDIT